MIIIFYVRSVNTVGKSTFVEAVGRASDDAEGYLDFFKGLITESHLGKELLEKVDLTEDKRQQTGAVFERVEGC
ncbi:tail component of prophage CP-933K [Escherichia coli]|nr:tail component of prophage CP-933K [Escherichia coli]